MKKLFWLLLAQFFIQQSHAQHVYQIRADSVRIYNVCDTAELIIENRTRGVNGFLYNKSNGRTEFHRIQLESIGNGKIAIPGQDTLDLSVLPGIGGIDTIYRAGDSIRYLKKGKIYAIYAPASSGSSGVTLQTATSNGRTVSDANWQLTGNYGTNFIRMFSTDGAQLLYSSSLNYPAGFITSQTGKAFFGAHTDDGSGSKVQVSGGDINVVNNYYGLSSVKVSNLYAGIGAEAGFSATTNAGSMKFGIKSTSSPEPLAYISVGNVPLTFGTNSLERMRITSSGNIGIGVNNPANKVTLGDGNYIAWKEGNGVEGAKITGTYGFLDFYGGGQKAMSIGINGTVGINTDATSVYKLDVNGMGYFTGHVNINDKIILYDDGSAELDWLITNRLYAFGETTLGGDVFIYGAVTSSRIIDFGNGVTGTVGASVSGSLAYPVGTDMSGKITLYVSDPSSLAAEVEYFTITFSTPFNSEPNIVFSPASPAAALLQSYLKNPNTNSFQIATAAPVTLAPGTYIWTYHIIGNF